MDFQFDRDDAMEQKFEVHLEAHGFGDYTR